MKIFRKGGTIVAVRSLRGLSGCGLLLVLGLVAGCAGAPVAEDNSPMAEAHYKIGVAGLNRNDLQKALVEFQKAINLNPGDKKLHFAIAQVYDRQERSGEAVRELGEAIRIDSTYSEAYNYLGTIHTKEHRYDEALRVFGKALENPLYATPQMTHYNMGLTYQAMGREDEALKKFQQSTRIDPSFMPGYLAWGQLAGRMGRYKEAVDAWRGAISLAPEALDVRMELATALYNDHQDALAIQEFRRVVREDKDGLWADSARRYLEVLQK
ncbi:MAG: tetratricopeptide repeat protein [Nitrospirota bacterium]|nr:tetratricopeptide repeat protein [Nitrospirota bacterium]